MKKQFLIILILCLSIYSVNAQGGSIKTFKDATQLYNDGQYDKAIKNYEELLGKGLYSAELYYNLGNAHYKLNNIAKSIYYYECALLLNPEDEQTLNNLKFAMRNTLDTLDETPQNPIHGLLDKLSLINPSVLNYLAIISCLLLSIFLVVYKLKKNIIFMYTAILMMVIGTSSILFLVHQKTHYNSEMAIIFTPEVTIHSEPNGKATTLFKLHKGAKIKIVEKLNRWSKIKLTGGQNGWIENDNIKVINVLNPHI